MHIPKSDIYGFVWSLYDTPQLRITFFRHESVAVVYLFTENHTNLYRESKESMCIGWIYIHVLLKRITHRRLLSHKLHPNILTKWTEQVTCIGNPPPSIHHQRTRNHERSLVVDRGKLSEGGSLHWMIVLAPIIKCLEPNVDTPGRQSSSICHKRPYPPPPPPSNTHIHCENKFEKERGEKGKHIYWQRGILKFCNRLLALNSVGTSQRYCVAYRRHLLVDIWAKSD